MGDLTAWPSGEAAGSALATSALASGMAAVAAIKVGTACCITMGVAPLLVWWKWRALRTGEARYDVAARFWAKILGATFAVGVVTGIPMEFQFGTNWAPGDER